jgi:hypothetical protein
MAGVIVVGLLGLGVAAACDGEDNGDDKKTSESGGGGNADAASPIEDYCDRVAEFVSDAQQDPPDPELVDVGTELFAEGNSIAETSGGDPARAAECTGEAEDALTDLILELGPAAT